MLEGQDGVADFGMQWRALDPYPRLESVSYGHLFGRFLLAPSFFAGKAVADLGCGNGRLAQFVVRDAREYLGVEFSDAIEEFRFPDGMESKVKLLRASIEQLPVKSTTADVVLCWGVLHHVRDPWAAAREMQRILRPGGTILLFVYPDGFEARENLNRLFRHVAPAAFRDFCGWLLPKLREWGELDPYLMGELSRALSVRLRLDPQWELFQAYDGLGPAYHHLLEQAVPKMFPPPWRIARTHEGCYRIA